MEPHASQMTFSLNKYAATEGSVGWLQTSTTWIRRAGLSSLFCNQPDVKRDWPNVESGQERRG